MGGNRYALMQIRFEETREAIFENLCILRLISLARSNNLIQKLDEYELTEYVHTGYLNRDVDEDLMESLLNFSGEQIEAAMLEDGVGVGSFDLHRDLLLSIAATLIETVGDCEIHTDSHYARENRVLPRFGVRRLEKDQRALELMLAFQYDRDLDIQFQAAQLEILRRLEGTRWEVTAPDGEDDGFVYNRTLRWPDAFVLADLKLEMNRTPRSRLSPQRNTVEIYLYIVKQIIS